MNEINDNKKAMSEDVKQALIRFNKDNIYVQNLKIELADMSLGYVKGKMMVTEDVLNPYGSVHGGCLYSLADIVSGIAACTYGKFSSTIDGTMTYIAPAMNTPPSLPVTGTMCTSFSVSAGILTWRSARARRCHCTRQIFTMTRDSL